MSMIPIVDKNCLLLVSKVTRTVVAHLNPK